MASELGVWSLEPGLVPTRAHLLKSLRGFVLVSLLGLKGVDFTTGNMFLFIQGAFSDGLLPTKIGPSQAHTQCPFPLAAITREFLTLDLSTLWITGWVGGSVGRWVGGLVGRWVGGLVGWWVGGLAAGWGSRGFVYLTKLCQAGRGRVIPDSSTVSKQMTSTAYPVPSS